MFKKTIIAAGIIASSVALTMSTSAATIAQTAVGPDLFAQELFGAGSDAVVLTSGATVVLTTAATNLDAGEIADITYTLSNGAFGATVALGDIVLSAGAATITKTAGGAAGDTSVTFRVEVTTAVAAASTLTLTVTSLTSASGLADTTTPTTVTVATTIAQVATSGGGAFPTSITQTSGTLATSASELTLTTGAGVAATIDVDNRSDLNAGVTAIDHDADGGTTPARDGVTVGTSTIALVGAAQEADGSAFSFADAGAGNLDMTVTGNFNSGDVVCIDIDAGADCDAGEIFTISGSTASLSVPLAALGADTVYYVANGTSTLAPTTFTYTQTTNFDDATGLNDTGTTSAGVTSFSGLTADGWSLAVPKSTSADIANIRVTNETSSEVSVFAQGWSQDGTSLGFQEISTLAANETQVLNAATLEGLFGTWSGRARFDFSTSGNVSVQTFIRSGGILNNMNGSAGISNNGNSDVR
ncbi:MAG: hypothetical protein KUG75_04545 [Pseudomonadales bacterium]|nr:hypothetical protein [Pseudomonadales bacterium]